MVDFGRMNEWPPSACFDSLNRDFTLYRDFLMWTFILVTRFRSLNRDFTLNRDSLNRDFTAIRNGNANEIQWMSECVPNENYFPVKNFLFHHFISFCVWSPSVKCECKILTGMTPSIHSDAFTVNFQWKKLSISSFSPSRATKPKPNENMGHYKKYCCWPHQWILWSWNHSVLCERDRGNKANKVLVKRKKKPFVVVFLDFLSNQPLNAWWFIFIALPVLYKSPFPFICMVQ